MSDASGQDVGPLRLALTLTLFAIPGAGVALLLWHEAVNPVLSGHPLEISVWTLLGLVGALALVVWLLSLYLRRLAGGGES